MTIFFPALCLRALACAALIATLSSCQTTPRPVVEEAPAEPVLFEWYGDDLQGPVAIRIDLSEQKALITRGGQPAGWTYVAAGIEGHRTPTGSFRITEKVEDKYSGSWGMIVDADGNTLDIDAKRGREPVPAGGRFVGAPMPYWMRIKGPIGMHAGPIPRPGFPASHGCIRLPRPIAEKLFELTELGTPVKVTY